MSKKLTVIAVSVLGCIVVAVGLPWFIPNRQTAAADACIANLKQIDGAKEQWALENRQEQRNFDYSELTNSFLMWTSQGTASRRRH